MTNQVIENVRRALGRAADAPIPERPPIQEPRQPLPVDSEIDQFFKEVNKLSGVGARLAEGAVSDTLSVLIEEKKIRKAVMWDTNYLKELKIPSYLESLGVELAPPNAEKNEMAGCDLGITEVDFILPETGTIALLSSPKKPRAVSLLPRVHLAIARQSALRADMHHVFAEAKDDPYLVFITGPSRTADIELTVTLGVHGPKELYVWMMDE